MQYFSTRSLSLVVVAASFAASIAAAQTTLPAPKFLYSTDNAGGKVHGYLVNATTGSIKPNGQKPPWAHWAPTRTASDKGGYRLYVINSGSKDIDAYFINRSNGYLSKVPGAPFAIGRKPLDVKVHPSGHYVYVSAQSNWVYAFQVQSRGKYRM